MNPTRLLPRSPSLRSEGQGRRAAEGGEGEDPQGQHPPARVPVAAFRQSRRAAVDLGAGGRPGQLPQAVRPLQEQVSHPGGNVGRPSVAQLLFVPPVKMPELS